MKDYPGITKLISDIIVNELKFKLEYDDLDSDLLQLEKHYSRSDGSVPFFHMFFVSGQVGSRFEVVIVKI